ncbi:bacillithiol biosynthesis cysteine-adding enzyme BshC [Deinococcus sp. Marseille-Q6407]|uniref:bacillithiol biosynthesis cysteine-adding enzyme BshC n=1 Tax=Deinococcus sp. Marseille-Q6407 TaxID=2969223 RepID=UPI0021C0B7A7|nr:bacillithiol biosynthesis cysteine-adding enzyme BshC [Deinococcus sp. Marseille-Q6407]
MPDLSGLSVAAAYRQGQLNDFFVQAWPQGTPRDWVQAWADAGEASRQLDPQQRAALVLALREYHASLGLLTPATEAALAALAHPAARVVVAGQQAGLLTGPAYAVHKAADAALLARELSREDAPVVGVFWIASQDHDAEEVAWVSLLDLEEQLWREVVELPAGRPVGRIPWRAEWTEILRELLQRFEAPEPHRQAVLARLERATAPLPDGRTPGWADVFARLMHGLLSDAGLLLLDPLFPALARLMAPTIARELERPLEGPARIEEAAGRLLALGLTPQLRRPAGATNLFLEEDDGQRRLLRVSGETFSTDSGREYTRAELLALLERDPSLITPAAGLRPIVQDTLLPNLALILGDGEIAYLSELTGVYELHGTRQPVVWPRLSVTWLEPNVARLLGRLGATAAEVQADPAGVLGRSLAASRGLTAASQERLAALAQQWQDLSAELAALDPTLERGSERARLSTERHFARLQQRALAALARQEDTRSGQLSRLRLHLLPHGHLQERELSFVTFLLKHGEVVLDLLLAQPAGAQAEVKIP